MSKNPVLLIAFLDAIYANDVHNTFSVSTYALTINICWAT